MKEENIKGIIYIYFLLIFPSSSLFFPPFFLVPSFCSFLFSLISFFIFFSFLFYLIRYYFFFSLSYSILRPLSLILIFHFFPLPFFLFLFISCFAFIPFSIFSFLHFFPLSSFPSFVPPSLYPSCIFSSFLPSSYFLLFSFAFPLIRLTSLVSLSFPIPFFYVSLPFVFPSSYLTEGKLSLKTQGNITHTGKYR